MFDAIKSMGALAGLLRDKDRARAIAAEVALELSRIRAEGEAGGGAVRVTAAGDMKIVSVRIAPAMLAGSTDMAQGLIAEATNAALLRARVEAERIVRDRLSSLGLGDLFKGEGDSDLSAIRGLLG